ncbi:MAG: hypothetical protein ACOYB3_01860 [Azonexus sp.]
MEPKDYAVDNASRPDLPNDTHPCGPGQILSHSFLDGECQDCGFCCEDHPSVDPEYGGVCDCGITVPADEPEEYDDSDDAYERYKDDIIESGGHWPPWRKD